MKETIDDSSDPEDKPWEWVRVIFMALLGITITCLYIYFLFTVSDL